MITISQTQDMVFRTAVQKGWWPIHADNETEINESVDLSKVNIPEKLALMHSELSEALEHYRNGDNLTEAFKIDFDLDNKPDGFWIELADCIIRILDLSGAYGINMENMVLMKAEYNKTRPYRHGGKRA